MPCRAMALKLSSIAIKIVVLDVFIYYHHWLTSDHQPVSFALQ